MAPRKKIVSKRDKLLRDLYYNPAAPGSFSSAKSLAKAAQKKLKEGHRKTRIKVDDKSAQKFLSGQETYTLHRPARKNYPRRRVMVSGALHQFQCDLVDMSMFAEENNDTKWILMVIDVFSKKAFAIAVKRKDATHMVNAFKELFRQTPPPRKLQSDKGSEFLAKPVQDYLKSQKITFFTSEDDRIKAGVVERLNRTIKGKMWKYFHYKKSNRWLEVLPQLMQSYNDTVHSSIKMTPNEANQKENEVDVRTNLYGPESRLPVEYNKSPRVLLKDNAFEVGDRVKLSKHALIFDKGYKPNWTLEILTVTDVVPSDPTVYRVTDLDGEEIKGMFYEHELQKVSSLPEVYDIEKVLEERDDRVKVKWKGYPSKFNSWVMKSALQIDQ